MSTPVCHKFFPDWGYKLLVPLSFAAAEMDDILAQTNGCGREGVEGRGPRRDEVRPSTVARENLGRGPEPPRNRQGGGGFHERGPEGRGGQGPERGVPRGYQRGRTLDAREGAG